jgi:hypothetical protein
MVLAGRSCPVGSVWQGEVKPVYELLGDGRHTSIRVYTSYLLLARFPMKPLTWRGKPLAWGSQR